MSVMSTPKVCKPNHSSQTAHHEYKRQTRTATVLDRTFCTYILLAAVFDDFV